MRLAIVVNSFPSISETFIFNKVMGLRQKGVDVAVWTHSSKNDERFFEKQLDGIHVDFVKKTILAHTKFFVPLVVSIYFLRNPMAALQLLFRAKKLYKHFPRAIKAWILSLPFALHKYDLIHFEYSGLAVTYLDAIPLIRPSKIITSCRGHRSKSIAT